MYGFTCLFLNKLMGLWQKAKGFFGRIGRGIKDGTSKVYNWVTNNKDKIQKGLETVDGLTKHKYSDTINKGQSMITKGLDMASKLGIGG